MIGDSDVSSIGSGAILPTTSGPTNPEPAVDHVIQFDATYSNILLNEEIEAFSAEELSLGQ